jgi:hypothetical protein
VFARLELERAAGGTPFADRDVSRLEALIRSLGGVLEIWFRMSCDCRKDRGLAGAGACS